MTDWWTSSNESLMGRPCFALVMENHLTAPATYAEDVGQTPEFGDFKRTYANGASAPTTAGAACYHCGARIRGAMFASRSHAFCCQGCLTVFELLTENGLADFYNLSEAAGVRIKGAPQEEVFKYLDEATVRERLVDFADDRMTKATFHIPTIHCIACVWLLENLFRLKPGIGQVQVNFPRKEVSITFATSKLKLSEVVALLASLGYEPELKLSSLDVKPRNGGTRRLWIQLGLAGFAFGNIMLFSISAYLGLDTFAGPGFRKMVGVISLVLALPVVIYSALDYWRAAWTSLRQRLLNIDVPIAAGVAAIFVQSCYEVLSGRGDGYFDSLCGLIFFLLCGRLFQQKTYDRLAFDRDYKSFFPIAVTRRIPLSRPSTTLSQSDGERDGVRGVSSVSRHLEEQVSLAQLAVGDGLIIRNGELIPADAKLVRGPALIDYSFVTGEFEPVEKKPGDYLYAGGRQMGGVIEIETVKAVSQSYLTSLWNQELFRKEKRAALNTLTNIYSQRFTKLVIAIALGAAVFWAFVNPAISVKAFTSVLIVACPCALALAAPFALGTAQRVLARRNVFLKNPFVIETLAKVDAVVFDKTGTLTAAGAGSVAWCGNSRVSLAPGFSPVSAAANKVEPFERLANFAKEETVETVSPSHHTMNTRLKPGANEKSASFSGALSESEERWLFSMTRHSTHPLPVRIGEAIKRDYFPETVRSFLETPGCGMEGSVDGHEIWMGAAAWLEERDVLCSRRREEAEGEQAENPPSYVGGYGGSVVHVAFDGKYRGCFVLTSALRPEMEELIGALRGNYELALLSGDNEREREKFRAVFQSAAHVRFNQSPLNKLNFIEVLQKRGKTVMMLGDGLNDAGALQQSDVGVAVVENVSSFSPASDVILAAGMVSRMADVLHYAKQSVLVVRAAFLISAVYNAVGIAIAARGLLSPVVCAILMPLSSVTVVAFACGAAAWFGSRLGEREARS